MILTDNCGRPLLNLRISITQRCNFRCDFCHKEGEGCSRGESEEMTTDEIVHIARIAVGLNISRIKITGGEPLMRQDLCDIAEGIGEIEGLKDLSMTTNGSLLAKQAKKLKNCGLRRVNISLPTLDPEAYHKLTNGDLQNTLKGIEAAVKAGLCPVKLNMVVLNGINVNGVPEMMDFARKTGTILQLIELDPVNVDEDYFSTYHRVLDEYEEMLKQKALAIETRKFMHNRHVYRLPDVTVEIVHPTENREFCAHCTRLRVTSNGMLKTCLMRNDNLIDILTPLRKGASDEELKRFFLKANQIREPFNKSAQFVCED